MITATTTDKDENRGKKKECRIIEHYKNLKKKSTGKKEAKLILKKFPLFKKIDIIKIIIKKRIGEGRNR